MSVAKSSFLKKIFIIFTLALSMYLMSPFCGSEGLSSSIDVEPQNSCEIESEDASLCHVDSVESSRSPKTSCCEPLQNDKWNFLEAIKRIILVISALLGICFASVLGILFSILIFLKTGKAYQLKTEYPPRLRALYTLCKAVDIKNPLGLDRCVKKRNKFFDRVTGSRTATPACSAFSSPQHRTKYLKCSCDDCVSSKILVSKEVDKALSALVDAALENELLPWYSSLVVDTSPALLDIRRSVWYILSRVVDLCRSVDGVGFLTRNVATCLTRHLLKIRLAQQAGEKTGERGVLELVPQLSSPEKERNFLRRLAEYFLLHTLPSAYYNCPPLNCVLRELLACKIFEVGVDMVCSPDWINERIVALLPLKSSQQDSLQSQQNLLLATSNAVSMTPGSAASMGSSSVRDLLDVPSTSTSTDCTRFLKVLVKDFDQRVTETSVEQLIECVQSCTDEDRLEALRQELQKELRKCTDVWKDGSEDVAPSHIKGLLQRSASARDFTRVRAECERRLLAVKAGLDDTPDSCNKEHLCTSFKGVLESAFSRRHLHSYLVSLLVTSEIPMIKNEPCISCNALEDAVSYCERHQSDSGDLKSHQVSVKTLDVREDLFPEFGCKLSNNGKRLTPSGVAALGLYCSLQELLCSIATADLRASTDLRTQIYYTYFTPDCMYPLPVDEKVKHHIWQLILAGTFGDEEASKNLITESVDKESINGATSDEAILSTKSSTSTVTHGSMPLIGCLAGAQEEVGQFLQTRYSAGFLHSSHHQNLLTEAATLSIPTVNKPAQSSKPKVAQESSPCPFTLQQQLFHASSIVATFQEKLTYKIWACKSLPPSSRREIRACRREIEELTRNLTVYETHLNTLQFWVENLGKWRVYVQDVEFAENRENPDIVLLVSMEDMDSSGHQGGLQLPQPSPQSSSPSARSPLGSERSSPQPRAAASSVNSEAVVQDDEDDNISFPQHDEAADSSATKSKKGPLSASDGLKNTKSKSLSFEKDYSLSSSSQAFKHASSSLDKILYGGEQILSSSNANLSSKNPNAPPEKSADFLKSKNSTGSLERIFTNLSSMGSRFSKSGSLGSAVAEGDIDSSHPVSDDYTSGSKLPERPPSCDKRFLDSATCGEFMDGWVVVRKLSQFEELHKKMSQYWPSLKTREVPSLVPVSSSGATKSLFSSVKSSSVLKNQDNAASSGLGDGSAEDRLRAACQRYLSALTWDALDPGPARSVFFYELVCPRQDLLWRPPTASTNLCTAAKKSKFSLSSFFKGREGRVGDSDDEESVSAPTLPLLPSEPFSKILADALSDSSASAKATLPMISTGPVSQGVISTTSEMVSLSRNTAAAAMGKLEQFFGVESAVIETSQDGCTPAIHLQQHQTICNCHLSPKEVKSTEEKFSELSKVSSGLEEHQIDDSDSGYRDCTLEKTSSEVLITDSQAAQVVRESFKSNGDKGKIFDKTDSFLGLKSGRDKAAVRRRKVEATTKTNSASALKSKRISSCTISAGSSSVLSASSSSALSAAAAATGSSGTVSGASSSATVSATGGSSTSEPIDAEPLFALLEELCELRGMGKLLRKTLVSFVHMTYGKNITRHVRETASGLLSDEMLVQYIDTVRLSLWPEPSSGASRSTTHTSTKQNECSWQRTSKFNETKDSLAEVDCDESHGKKSSARHAYSSNKLPQRSQKEIDDTRREAWTALKRSVPPSLGTLVGANNAIKGVKRLFVALQHHALNKNLFYNIIEELLQEVFPELRERMEAQLAG